MVMNKAAVRRAARKVRAASAQLDRAIIGTPTIPTPPDPGDVGEIPTEPPPVDPPLPPDPPSTTTTVERHGITLTFDGEVAVSLAANGDPFIQAPCKLVSISPEWDGKRNGAMLNPRYIKKSGVHPEHGYYGAEERYGAELNIAPGLKAGHPLTMLNGDAIVATIGEEDDYASKQKQLIMVAACFTFVDELPESGRWFRPSPFDPDRGIDYEVGDLRTGLVPSVASLPGAPSIQGLEQASGRSFWLSYSGWSTGSRVHPSLAYGGKMSLLPGQGAPDNTAYGRHVARTMEVIALGLCTDIATPQEKLPTIINVVQGGLDWMPAIRLSPSFWHAAGGWMHGHKWPIVFAEMMLGTDEFAGREFSSEDEQTFRIGQEHVDRSQASNDTEKYTAADIGKAGWQFREGQVNATWVDDGTNPYRLCCTAIRWFGMVLCAELIPGMREQWGNEDIFDYIRRYRRKAESTGWMPFKWVLSMWDKYAQNPKGE